MNGFKLIRTCSQSKARAGELMTSHGVIPTPVFMPVGSQATVKTLTGDDLKTLGYGMVLANTYHLYLRPGMKVMAEMGGLHKFMNWDGAILTDSGGYQVFSLAPLRKITEEGVTFRSHIDGSEHFLTPELAVRYQETIGADVMMALDECAPHDAPGDKVMEAMERTHRWAERCLKAHHDNGQMLFGIVQGGMFTELRQRSASALTALEFPGYAIGGLSLGETKQVTYDITGYTAALLPPDKPRYLMGVGSPEDIIEGVARGIDMFDCALPTRVARNGGLFTREGRRNIRNAGFAGIKEAFDTGCGCYTCRNYSAGYLHHLFNAGELLGLRLATIHNLFFMRELMDKTRQAIMAEKFSEFYTDFKAVYQPTNETVRVAQKEKWLKNRPAAESV
jgi:queuine tRNA-ribosyltransferase